MTIAINSIQFIRSGSNDYFFDYFLNIAVSHTEHHFIFITPTPVSGELISPANMVQVISCPRAGNPLMWKIWLDYTLPGIARKYRADILFNTGGVCSLRTKITQWLFICDLSFLYSPRFFSKKHLYFLGKYMPAFLDRTTTIVTASDFLKKEIMQRYLVDGSKLITFQLAAGSQYQPAGWSEKETVKAQYAAGKEYFLFSGEIHPRNNLVNLLKAFSFFKKRQKSNMQLIITARQPPANDPFIENYKTYKYRNEVNLLMDLPEEEIAKITAAAYAFLYPSAYEGSGLAGLRAMQCEVPVITGNTGALKEIAGDAVLYVDPENFEDIAYKMMLLFKDETQRTELIKKGKLIVQKNNKESMNDHWRQAILPLVTRRMSDSND